MLGKQVVGTALRRSADRDQALRGYGFGQRGGVLVADLGGIAGQLRVSRDRPGGGEQLLDRSGGQCLADCLRTFGKETPGLAPRRPSGKTARGSEPGVT
ncbi:MAG TPA: hypothetical protein VFE19_03070 [Jatrophihabitantaceae bacterium]|jgi:hypothetical protein|nr:hypothetical protein [Jatrophihabitantaceae bacterium]